MRGGFGPSPTAVVNDLMTRDFTTSGVKRQTGPFGSMPFGYLSMWPPIV